MLKDSFYPVEMIMSISYNSINVYAWVLRMREKNMFRNVWSGDELKNIYFCLNPIIPMRNQLSSPETINKTEFLKSDCFYWDLGCLTVEWVVVTILYIHYPFSVCLIDKHNMANCKAYSDQTVKQIQN